MDQPSKNTTFRSSPMYQHVKRQSYRQPNRLYVYSSQFNQYERQSTAWTVCN
jgi:hypothetical protein